MGLYLDCMEVKESDICHILRKVVVPYSKKAQVHYLDDDVIVLKPHDSIT